MRNKRPRFLLMLTAMTVGGVAAQQLPAFAAPAHITPTITIAAKSPLPKVTGDVWVIWRSTKDGKATISGTVTGGQSGEVVRVFAKQFPYTKKPVQIGSAVSVSSSPSKYSVQAAPTLATRYQAKLFANSTTTTPIASSPVVTVYVVGAGSFRGARRCGRPVCHQTIRVIMHVPPSTLRTEIAKRWFTYFGLRLSRTGAPPPPRFLKLGAGNGHASKSRKTSRSSFAVTLTFSFRIGNNGYYWLANACTRDTESKDGLNLPGHHGCGTLKVISSKRVYLG